MSSRHLEDYMLSCLICHFTTLHFCFRHSWFPFPNIQPGGHKALFISSLSPNSTTNNQSVITSIRNVFQVWFNSDFSFPLFLQLSVPSCLLSLLDNLSFCFLYFFYSKLYNDSKILIFLTDPPNQITFLTKNFGHSFSRYTCSFFLYLGPDTIYLYTSSSGCLAPPLPKLRVSSPAFTNMLCFKHFTHKILFKVVYI